MKCLVIFAVFLAAASALHFPVVEDEEGEQYYVVPVRRSKRQTTNWQIENPGIGTLSHTGTILDNDIHRLDGTGYVSKDLTRGGIVPENYGGRLDYGHKPTGSVLGLGADHMMGQGTNVKAQGTWNFIHTKDAEVGLTGQYGRQFGGPRGTGKPDYGVFLGGKFRF